jgi:hypothetical protein
MNENLDDNIVLPRPTLSKSRRSSIAIHLAQRADRANFAPQSPVNWRDTLALRN